MIAHSISLPSLKSEPKCSSFDHAVAPSCPTINQRLMPQGDRIHIADPLVRPSLASDTSSYNFLSGICQLPPLKI